MKILAIDPGTTESAYVMWDGAQILAFGKEKNEDLRRGRLARVIRGTCCNFAVIEKVASYGMPVGEEVFETVFWSGIFAEQLRGFGLRTVDRIPRLDVKMHLCHSARGNDATIKKALVDRFAWGQKNYGKGTKANPGFFYGFAKDIWAAFAVAVTYHDKEIDV